MARIELDDFYLRWVNQNVRPAIENSGAHLSDSAAQLLAYAMQSQVDLGFVRNREHAIGAAEELLRFIRDGYWPPLPPLRPFGGPGYEVNFNVALHLMVDLNRLALAFPWKTTD
jgi:hypothetical protein